MPEDELNQNYSPEGEELEALKARIAELEGLVAEKDDELKAKDTRLSEAEAKVAELEQVIAERDSELAALKQAMAESEKRWLMPKIL